MGERHDDAGEQGQCLADIGELFGDPRHHEDHQCRHRQRGHGCERRRIGQRRLHATLHFGLAIEQGRKALQHLRQRAGAFAGGHHGAVERRKAGAFQGHCIRKPAAFDHRAMHSGQHGAGLVALRLLDDGAQRFFQRRHTGQRRQLAGEQAERIGFQPRTARGQCGLAGGGRFQLGCKQPLVEQIGARRLAARRADAAGARLAFDVERFVAKVSHRPALAQRCPSPAALRPGW